VFLTAAGCSKATCTIAKVMLLCLKKKSKKISIMKKTLKPVIMRRNGQDLVSYRHAPTPD